MSYATFSAHNAYWRSLIFEWGMINLWGSPIFGIGLNDWVRPFFMHSSSIDNFWLLNAMQYGIPGFVLLGVGYLPALWWVGRRNFDADQRLFQLRRAWMLTFAGLTLTLCTVHVWTSIYSFVFFLFGAGMWFLTVDASSDQQNPDSVGWLLRGKTANSSKLKRTTSADNTRPADVIGRASHGEISYSRFARPDTNRKAKETS